MLLHRILPRCLEKYTLFSRFSRKYLQPLTHRYATWNACKCIACAFLTSFRLRNTCKTNNILHNKGRWMYRSEDHYERSCVLLAHVFTPSNNAEGGDGIWRADARFQPSYADVADSQEVQRIEKCPFEFLQGSFFNFQKQSPFVAQIRHEGNSSDLPLPSYPNLESLRDSIAPFSMSDKKKTKKNGFIEDILIF